MLSVLAITVCLSVSSTFAGRAFPRVSEKLALNIFQEINANIRKDPTNFLTDLSGRYAVCDSTYDRELVVIDRKTPEGATIGLLLDVTQGSGATVGVVSGYIETILKSWRGRNDYAAQIKSADLFGCSVQPACAGDFAIVACLFSPGYTSDREDIKDMNEGKVALAFTSEQYRLTETYLGVEWDRSYLLENLSGKETECAMIATDSWDFKKAEEEAKKRRMLVSGLFGHAPNKGSTQEAMTKILASFKKTDFAKMGCSVIPDCNVPGGGLEVVVSCLFLER